MRVAPGEGDIRAGGDFEGIARQRDARDGEPREKQRQQQGNGRMRGRAAEPWQPRGEPHERVGEKHGVEGEGEVHEPGAAVADQESEHEQ